jgi:hypothetical protein
LPAFFSSSLTLMCLNAITDSSLMAAIPNVSSASCPGVTPGEEAAPAGRWGRGLEPYHAPALFPFPQLWGHWYVGATWGLREQRSEVSY